MTFEEAAAIPLAGQTALQGLRDVGRVESGQHVLVNGATGGVGTLAVQIAKSMGATVTGVCTERNVDLVRSLGADRVVAYDREDFVDLGQRVDVFFDGPGNRPWRDVRKVLVPGGRHVMVGGPKNHKSVDPIPHMIRFKLGAMIDSRTVGVFLATASTQDLEILAEMAETGVIAPVIEESFPLADGAAAMGRFEKGHLRGKLVVQV